MLEPMEDAPAHILALRASGTVMAGDVEKAIEAALAPTASTGLVVVIDREFDGYFAELARGLKHASLAHKNLVKVAVVTEADRMDEAKLGGFDGPAVPIRLFAANDRRGAYDWAAAARRGE